MRGRQGGLLGSGLTLESFTGIWRASEIYTLRARSIWPSGSLLIGMGSTPVFADDNGDVSITATVTTNYASYSSVWQSYDGDTNDWVDISGSENNLTLSLTGLTSVGYYRLYVQAGTRIVIGEEVEVQLS